MQHVVEVIEHPKVTSERELNVLYQRIGESNRAGGVQGWETKAAQAVTYEVRRELSTGTPRYRGPAGAAEGAGERRAPALVTLSAHAASGTV